VRSGVAQSLCISNSAVLDLSGRKAAESLANEPLHCNTVHSCFFSKHFGPYVGRLTRPFATSRGLSLRGAPWSAVAADAAFLDVARAPFRV